MMSTHIVELHRFVHHPRVKQLEVATILCTSWKKTLGTHAMTLRHGGFCILMLGSREETALEFGLCFLHELFCCHFHVSV